MPNCAPAAETLGVLTGIEQIDGGKFTEYEGREGLGKLANEVKSSGRQRLAQRASTR